MADAAPDSTAPPAPSALSRIVAHMSSNKIEALLWILRLFILGCCFNFILPIFGGNQFGVYQKALIANAAQSALRLHQRLPQVQLSREFFGRVLVEDSAHYLFYSILFMYSSPVSVVLMPVMLFALLHAQTYTRALLDLIGPNSMLFVRRILSKVSDNQISLLRFVSINEVILMPFILVMMFQGTTSLLQPFMYYRFLTLRYSSQRNPYCRQTFYELRVTIETLIWKPQCPAFVRTTIQKIIAFMCNLAPQVPTAEPQAQ